ncbi:MAG: dihydrodipicolinate synthase family protein [Acidobacteria bacterium]|nr:dihydrodipicolinate synthase family protein [Acidobacteriota bacterium]
MSEKTRYPLRGIVVSLNTPFDADGRIDFGSLERLVEWHLRCGAVGFLTPARAAEVDALTLDERLAIIERVSAQVRGRAELVACATSVVGSNADGTVAADTRAIAEAAARLGCEGVLAEIPPARRAARDGMRHVVDALAATGPPMVMIQDLDWGTSGLPVDVIADTFERVPAFRCLKVEVVPAGPKYTAVLEATRGRLHVSGGWAADQMIEALDRGVDVFMPTAMTGIYRMIYQAHEAGDRATARQWFSRILPVLAFTRQHLDVSIQFYKRLYHRRGIFTTPAVRNRTVAYDAFHARYGEELLGLLDAVERDAGLIEQDPGVTSPRHLHGE